MNRRDFLKGALTMAALAPVSRLAAKAGVGGDKTPDVAAGAQVTRRRYKETALTVPLWASAACGCRRFSRTNRMLITLPRER